MPLPKLAFLDVPGRHMSHAAVREIRPRPRRGRSPRRHRRLRAPRRPRRRVPPLGLQEPLGAPRLRGQQGRRHRCSLRPRVLHDSGGNGPVDEKLAVQAGLSRAPLSTVATPQATPADEAGVTGDLSGFLGDAHWQAFAPCGRGGRGAAEADVGSVSAGKTAAGSTGRPVYRRLYRGRVVALHRARLDPCPHAGVQITRRFPCTFSSPSPPRPIPIPPHPPRPTPHSEASATATPPPPPPPPDQT